MDPIRDIWRGNCVCGKWIILVKTYTEKKPFVCGGPCHANIACGRRWYWLNDKTVACAEPVQPEPPVKDGEDDRDDEEEE